MLAVCIKVVRVDDLETVAGVLQKQDVFIGDATRTASSRVKISGFVTNLWLTKFDSLIL